MLMNSSLPDRQQTPLRSLLDAYLSSLNKELPFLDATSSAAALRALDELLAASSASNPPPPGQPLDEPAQQRLQKALCFIDSHLEAHWLTPAAVAAGLNISVRHLHRMFEGRGQSVAHAIRQRRIERARALLMSDPSMSITDIAYCCGFDSLATFYRQFKVAFGTTATDLRQAVQA